MSNQQQLQQPTLGQIAQDLAESSQTCEICAKFFKKLSHYNRHMRERHTEFRDYICKEQDCGKTFKRGSHLKRHMISHTNIRNFKCHHCCMSFGYKHHLERHVKLIHLSQRIQCTSCDLKFKKKKAYNKHMEMHSNRMRQLIKKGSGEEHTITKIGGSIKNEDDIYNSDSESEEIEVKSEKLFYRCGYEDCLSAFERLSDFKRHLNKLHNESQD